MPRLKPVLKQSVLALTLILGVTISCFFIFKVLPGDPARIRLGPDASVEAVQRLRMDMGLNQPLISQLERYILNVVKFDFGRSWINGREVLEQVLNKMRVTLLIGGLGAMFALIGSYLLNLFCFLFPRLKWLLQITKVGIVTPSFFVGVFMAILFGIWVPIFSFASKSFGLYLLVAAIVSLYPLALMTQVFGEQIEKANQAEYGEAAHAFGFSKAKIFNKDLLPSVAVPWLAVWVNHLSVLLMGSLVLEIIFSIEGLGPMLVTAIERNDLPILQGILLLNAFLFIIIFWISEIAYRWIDPRIKNMT